MSTRPGVPDLAEPGVEDAATDPASALAGGFRPFPTPPERPNVILGTPENESLTGTPGRDLIVGNGGDDGLYGEEGDDTIVGNGQLVGFDGDDVLLATAPTPQQIVGSQIIAGRGDDLVVGNAFGDELFGDDGEDTVSGGAGADRVVGGLGRDVLAGGAGPDEFEYALFPVFGPPGDFQVVYAADTGVGPGRRDVVVDFEPGADVLGLEGYSIREFIGTDEFSDGGVGQVRYEFDGGNTVVRFRGTNLLSPDMFEGEIELLGVQALTSADFGLLA